MLVTLNGGTFVNVFISHTRSENDKFKQFIFQIEGKGLAPNDIPCIRVPDGLNHGKMSLQQA